MWWFIDMTKWWTDWIVLHVHLNKIELWWWTCGTIQSVHLLPKCINYHNQWLECRLLWRFVYKSWMYSAFIYICKNDIKLSMICWQQCKDCGWYGYNCNVSESWWWLFKKIQKNNDVNNRQYLTTIWFIMKLMHIISNITTVTSTFVQKLEPIQAISV